MKKIFFSIITFLAILGIKAQNTTDALLYSQDEIQGTARFRALSGAFGALGGDMSAVSINPAGSAVFNTSYLTASLINDRTKNKTNFFGNNDNSKNSIFDLNQVGGVLVLKNTDSNSNWKKITFALNYDKTANHNSDWFAYGTNTNSIDSYFLANAQGLALNEISAFPGETYSDAYADIGAVYGYGHQQAFLGYESYILEPENNTDDNTVYFSNIAPGDFNQEYSYSSNGFNGKFSINIAAQYNDNLYLGINFNSHLINYDRYTYLFESNSNIGSFVNQVGFENVLSTTGTGFSFQLGAIAKLSDNIRIGLAYKSPTWYTISEETTQYIATIRDESIRLEIDPRIINIFPDYKLQTNSKITGSFAYVFEDKGLISFDYSLKDYNNIKFRPTSDTYFSQQNNLISNNLKSAAVYRIGGEYRIKNVSLRGGYRFEESPYENENTIGDLSGYSFGLGYSFGNLNLDLTYDYFERETNYQLFDIGLTDTVNIDNRSNNITLSLSFVL